MSEKDHISSVDRQMSLDLLMRAALERHLFFLSCIEKAAVRLKYYRLFIVKTTWGLIIKNVWHVSTNFPDTIWNFRLPVVTCTSLWITKQNAPTKWRFLDIKRIFMEQNKHLLCNWESRECKHTKIIKGKGLIWLVTKVREAIKLIAYLWWSLYVCTLETPSYTINVCFVQ